MVFIVTVLPHLGHSLAVVLLAKILSAIVLEAPLHACNGAFLAITCYSVTICLPVTAAFAEWVMSTACLAGRAFQKQFIFRLVDPFAKCLDVAKRHVVKNVGEFFLDAKVASKVEFS